MENQVSNNPAVRTDFETFSLGYDAGVTHERERIINYLIDKGVLREALFYKGWVAMDTYGNAGVDLDVELGGE